jgi:endoglucanase
MTALGGSPVTGGVPATGGAATTGGQSTGGSGTSTGGVATGGKATGGTSTGGKATGGTATGGVAATGGSGATIGPLALRGVNLSCAEWGTNIPGTFNTDYTYPDSHYVSGYNGASYYSSKRMTVFRLPFMWERLQPSLSQAFNSAELTRLDTTVTDLLATGAYVILDPHNYARWNNTVIGSGSVTQAAFADLWTRLATKYGSNSKTIFGLMNEPHDIDNTTWVNAAQAAVNAIRATGSRNLILVPSNGWTNAASWTTYANALLTITDSANNLAFEAHNYFNSNASASDVCASTTIGVERLSNFTNWLKSNNRKGFLGEFSGNSAASNCQAAVTNMLDHVVANSSVYIGWAWWAGGPWWGSNWASLEPSGTTDNPKMAWLTPYL